MIFGVPPQMQSAVDHHAVAIDDDEVVAPMRRDLLLPDLPARALRPRGSVVGHSAQSMMLLSVFEGRITAAVLAGSP